MMRAHLLTIAANGLDDALSARAVSALPAVSLGS
jgi:hypothetical protein